jgi:hypothetical protein
MEWEQVLIELIGLVGSAAPALWEIARRQVLVNGVVNLVLTAVCAAAIVVSVKLTLWLFEEGFNADVDDIRSLIYPLFATCLMLSVVFIIGAMATSIITTIQYLGNPDYYAIKILLDLIK